MTKTLQLIASIAISQLAGIIGSFFTASSVKTWYVDLIKPSFNPPGWIFGPVWVTLYTMMGVSFYLVWQEGWNSARNKFAITLFLIHLVFNAMWSILFFGQKQLGIAFFEIIILWLMIFVLIIIFYKINKTASYLLIPYLLWVSFASVLNFYLWKLN